MKRQEGKAVSLTVQLFHQASFVIDIICIKHVGGHGFKINGQLVQSTVVMEASEWLIVPRRSFSFTREILQAAL